MSRDPRFYREYHAADGRVLGLGDVVKVRGRSGKRYRFAAWVEGRHDRYCLLRGEKPRAIYCKWFRIRPENVERERVSEWPPNRKGRTEPGIGYDGDAPGQPHEEPEPDEADEPAEPAPSRPLETLTCRECGEDWQRERKRGRKPKTCPTCKES